MTLMDADAGDGGTGAPPDVNESNRAPDFTREYGNGEITVRWFAKRCIHSAQCIRIAPAVFDPRRRPWIDLEKGDVERIMRAVDACPTGALEYVNANSAAIDGAETVVEQVPDGPLFLRGNITIKDEAGNVIRTASRVALCRCGGTKNPPFCDNSHRAKR
jgi:uncharacterized Fe-S cluster protein YjdI